VEDENVEMTNIDFVVSQFRKSSSGDWKWLYKPHWLDTGSGFQNIAPIEQGLAADARVERNRDA